MLFYRPLSSPSGAPQLRGTSGGGMGGVAVLDRGFRLRQGEVLGLGGRRLGPRGVSGKVGSKNCGWMSLL